jgi:serine/threonine protein kinase
VQLQKIRIALAIAQKIKHHLHANGIIWSDVKPGNVVVDLNKLVGG